MRQQPVERRGACACEALVARCSGEPQSVGLCHCRACQRRTGSTFGLAAFFPAAAVVVEGVSSPYVRRGESGSEVEFHFCPACGSTVYWLPHRKPGIIAVAVGAFADPAFPAPTGIFHAEDRAKWLGASGLGARPALER